MLPTCVCSVRTTDNHTVHRHCCFVAFEMSRWLYYCHAVSFTTLWSLLVKTVLWLYGIPLILRLYLSSLSHITARCTVTAATSSGIADGASALLLCNEAGLNGATPLARILAFSSYAHEPEWFTTAPVGAIRALLKQLNWTVDQVRALVGVVFMATLLVI
jgi:acetyl-CoA acetyltransferase